MQLQTTPLQICLKILSPANPFPGPQPGPHSQPISADILGMQPSYSVLYHNLHRTVNKTIFGTRMFVIPTCECGIQRQVKTFFPFYFALQIFLSSFFICVWFENIEKCRTGNSHRLCIVGESSPIHFRFFS